jgi:23S rRNA (cytidine1920-2'-O)/16S rRNA (cytidine1409-2'-O)-methyltransferase
MLLHMGKPSKSKIRLDALLVEHGLAPTRAKAQAVIMSGAVRVDGRRVDKAGTRVPPDSPVEVLQKPHPYVGRGGVKLEGALASTGIAVEGRRCLDVGASTGGFTHCLLLNGAAHVTALDVGHGQLDASLRPDARVRVLEGVNARRLDGVDLGPPFDLAVMDVSFISAKKIIPSLKKVLAPGGQGLVLVKPQFELERREVGRGGVVRDEVLQQKAVESVRAFIEEQGFEIHGMIESPIRGADGNREFFLHFRSPPSPIPCPKP